MRKFIHSNFEIDLSKLKVSDIIQNPWFSDKFFAKFTFPFEMDLSEENDINFGFISHYNANSHILLYEGKYVHRDIMEDAKLEIEEVSNRITLTLSYGFDEFPNFNKKLSELPLDRFEVPDIYTHAATIIPQTWPAVNYNFPQIHIDKIDNTNDPWLAFENIINNYKNGAFLVNEVDVDDVTYNRNIIQPTPYALHILKKGFEDAGRTLQGDVLTDAVFQKLCIYADTEYFTTFEQESINILKMSEDKIEFGVVTSDGVYPGTTAWSNPLTNPPQTYHKYKVETTIANPGKYRIVGEIGLELLAFDVNAFTVIKYRDKVLEIKHFAGTFLRGFHKKSVDIVFETESDLLPNTITIESFQKASAEKTIFDININPIRLHDASGNAIPTILNQNQVDLTRAVPDMTFGDFVNTLKNWFNLDLDLRGSEVHLNFIKNERTRGDVIDMRKFEVKTPVRKFTKGISYHLKFQDVNTKEYEWASVFHSADSISTSGFKTDDKTNEILINALPLPNTLRNGVFTAHGFDTDKSKLYAVLYDGLTDNSNITKETTDLLLPKVHESHWKDWLKFRIDSQGFDWSFIAYYEDIIDLKAKSRLFCYSLNHIVKNITRTEIAEDLFEVQIETEAK